MTRFYKTEGIKRLIVGPKEKKKKKFVTYNTFEIRLFIRC